MSSVPSPERTKARSLRAQLDLTSSATWDRGAAGDQMALHAGGPADLVRVHR